MRWLGLIIIKHIRIIQTNTLKVIKSYFDGYVKFEIIKCIMIISIIGI